MDAGFGHRDARLERDARRRWMIVSRAQLRALGFPDRTIHNRVTAERLREVFPGAYAVGGGEIAWQGLAYAALICIGEGAVLSYWTAAACHEILDPRPGWPHVTTTRRTGHSPDGIAVHRVRALQPDQVTFVHQLPVTSLERTLLDLAAAQASERVLQRAMNQAEFRGILDPVELERLATSGRKGSVALRRAMKRRAPTVSILEDAFFGAILDAELPPPLANWAIGPYRVDFYWPDHGFIVETDGWGAHGGDGGRAKDRRKDAYLRGRGLEVRHLTRGLQPPAISATAVSRRSASDSSL
jgi:hypothetical protein